jgi:hypothetical protein
MMIFHDRPGEEDHEEAGGADQHRGAQVGLAQHQPNGIASRTPAIDVVAQLQALLAAVEVPRERERHGELHDLRGLDGGEAEVQPAARAVADIAEERHPTRSVKPAR